MCSCGDESKICSPLTAANRTPDRVILRHPLGFALLHGALKLKLKADWIEPAHFRASLGASLQATVAGSLASQLNLGVRESAHWFDAGISIDVEEEILCAAIDEVYSDLKLAERVAVARRETM